MPSQRFSLPIALALTAFFTITTTSVSAQETEAKTRPLGTISGQVSLRGRAMAGVPVVAIFGDTINRRDTAARAITDGQGYYRLVNLPPGQYQIWSLTPGLIAESEPFPGYNPHGSVKSILLSANEDVAHVDLKLMSGCVITGRITNAENKPVVEERVSLDFFDEKGNPRFPVQRYREEIYRTDDRGVYRIYGLPPGHYKVSVGYDANEGVIGSTYPRTYYAKPDDPATAAVIELKEGDEAADVNIKIGAPADTFAVSGRIVDSTSGRPVEGLRYRIAVVQKDPGRAPAYMGLPTDRRGEFRFDRLLPGRYSIAATSDNYAGGNFYGDPITFEIVDQDVTGLEIKATPGLTLSGSIFVDGMATNEFLALVRDLRIFAWPEPQSLPQGTGGGSAVVAADGSFRITGLRPGRVKLNVDSMTRTATRPFVARVEREGIDVGQTLDLQQSVSGIVVTINYGTGSIRGTMTFAGGDLPADSRIFVRFRREGAREAMSIQTDVRGNFLIKNLAPGTYEVEVQLALSNRAPRARQPQKQLVNVTNGSIAEINFLVDFGQPRSGP